MDKTYMAIDQYGQTYHDLTHPRKDLCERLYNKHYSKIYIDDSKGNAQHVGYEIGGHWCTVYQVLPFKGEK